MTLWPEQTRAGAHVLLRARSRLLALTVGTAPTVAAPADRVMVSMYIGRFARYPHLTCHLWVR